MFSKILMASTCSAALLFGATVAGAGIPLEEGKGTVTWNAPSAAFQLAQAAEGEADGSSEGDEPSASDPTSEQGQTATDAEPAAGPADEGEAASDDPTGEESAVGATGEGTGGTHCEQDRVATGQPAESAPDTTC